MDQEYSQLLINKQLKVSKEYINTLPLYIYNGEIILIKNDNELSNAIDFINKEKLIGFDTETKPSFRKGEKHPIALLQIACSDRVYIFQIKLIKKIDLLAAILSSKKIKKVGIALQRDVLELQEIFKFSANSFLDLGSIAKQAGYSVTGLRTLAAIFLKVRISKTARRSDWSKLELSKAQIKYAATDAWVSRDLYLKMREHNVF